MPFDLGLSVYNTFSIYQLQILYTELQIRSVTLSSIDFTCVISSPNPMFDHLLESSHRDDSNKCSNKGYGEEITQVKSIEVIFTHLI